MLKLPTIKKTKILKFNKIWFSYFFVKVFYLFFANLVYANFTTLGDTYRYLAGPSAWQGNLLVSSTVMMDTLASSSAMIFGNYLGSLPFLIISFIGVYYPISKIQMNNKTLVYILLLLSFPSFGVWTSIASKEAVGVFYMGIILAGYIDVYERRNVGNLFMFFFAIYLCFIFKPQYMIGVFGLFSYTIISRKLGLNSGWKLLLFFISVLVGATFLYYFRNVIDDLSKLMPAHFSTDAGSTRDNTIWVDQYDFFWNAPYGIYIGFVGPTFNEALSKPTHFLAWLESMVILGVFSYFLIKYTATVLRFGRINVMFVCGFSILLFWILLVHYPFSALNPGSALRYRGSFYAFLVILFYYMYSRAMSPYLRCPVSKNGIQQ